MLRGRKSWPVGEGLASVQMGGVKGVGWTATHLHDKQQKKTKPD